MHVPEIVDVKNELEILKNEGLVADWDLPYENLLTRLSAAIFFITPTSGTESEKVWSRLANRPGFRYSLNEGGKLSDLAYRVTFSQDRS